MKKKQQKAVNANEEKSLIDIHIDIRNQHIDTQGKPIAARFRQQDLDANFQHQASSSDSSLQTPLLSQ